MEKFIIIKAEQNGGRAMEMSVVGTFDNYAEAKKAFEADFADQCAEYGVSPDVAPEDYYEWGAKTATEFELYDEEGLYAVTEKLVAV